MTIYQVGIINQNFDQQRFLSYSQSLQSDLLQVTILDLKEDGEALKKQEIIIIFVDEVEDIQSSVCSLILEIRKKTEAVIWTYQNTASSMSRMVYMQLGVDINIHWECSPEELTMLVANMQKRISANSMQQSGQSLSDNFNMFQRQVVLEGFDFKIEGKRINLTKKEYYTLCLLKSKIGRTVPYEEIYQEVWKEPYKNEKYKIANVIFHIRGKLENEKLEPDNYIRNIHNVGYMFNDVESNKQEEPTVNPY